MGPLEHLGENVLTHWYKKHDHEREEDTGYGDPSDAETDEQVARLEEREVCDGLEWHRLHKSGVVLLKHPFFNNNINIIIIIIVRRDEVDRINKE